MLVDSSPLSRGRIPSLDGLRAVAVAMVLLAHACQTHGFPGTPLTRRIFMHGAIGVEVFFVISGFLITTLMLREMDRTGGVSIKSFYVRRILRIIPAYACFLGVILLLNVAGRVHLQRRDWAAALTYTVNFVHAPTWEIGHVWSLSIEEHFYLMWPLVMVIGGALFARYLAAGLLVVCFAARWAVMLLAPGYTPMAELWTFTRLDTIACGCLLALIAWHAPGRAWLNRLAARSWLVGMAFVALVASLALSSISAKFSVGIAYTANSLLIAFLMWCAIDRHGSRLGRILNHKALIAVGVGSYSLYLWQQIFLNPHGNAFINQFPQNILFASAAAVISYSLIELPFLRLKKWSGGALALQLVCKRMRGSARDANAAVDNVMLGEPA